MSQSDNPKCFQVKNCQYQHHFLFYVFIFSVQERRGKYLIMREGGSACPRKWMAVILP